MIVSFGKLPCHVELASPIHHATCMPRITNNVNTEMML
jgi:hypothetical protein